MESAEPGPQRRFGLERGAVYPASEARALLNPLRHLVHPPGRLVRRLGLAAEAHVLEVGPGPGWFSRSLAAAVPRGRLHLLDLQPRMLELAVVRAASPVVETTVGDACELPFNACTFDAAVVSAVLGETPDPSLALAELARVLRSGGRIAVLETRTDTDYIDVPRLLELADAAGLRLRRRHGRVLGYTAILTR